MWNARGIISKSSEFKNYIIDNAPDIICITETLLKSTQNLRIKNYRVIREDRPDGYGGVAIIYHRSLKVRCFNLAKFGNGLLECISCQFSYLNKWSTIILVYNPCKNVNSVEFLHYMDQIPDQGIFCGDFNAHHPLWSSSNKINHSGLALVDAISMANKFTILNPKDAPTRIDPHSGRTSNLDLFIGTESYSVFKFSMCPDLGSDHLPISLSNGNSHPPRLFFRPRWSFNDDKWGEWIENIKKIEVPRSDKTTSRMLSWKHLPNCST